MWCVCCAWFACAWAAWGTLCNGMLLVLCVMVIASPCRALRALFVVHVVLWRSELVGARRVALWWHCAHACRDSTRVCATELGTPRVLPTELRPEHGPAAPTPWGFALDAVLWWFCKRARAALYAWCVVASCGRLRPHAPGQQVQRQAEPQLQARATTKS